MSTVVHKILLCGDQHFGRRLPPRHLGYLLVELAPAVREAVSMALRNRSTVRGHPPAWLDRASDVRFVEHEGNGQTTLFFESPTLGEAAEEVYRQPSLFPEMRPSPDSTGFDLLADVFLDVQTQQADSEHFDPALLNRITHFQRVFRRSPFKAIEMSGGRYPAERPVRFTSELIDSANSLLGRTPTPQRVRLVGCLDKIEASTQRFSVILDTKDKISGVFREEQIDAMQSLWRQRVLVLGTAVYRASGRLLRIDAAEVRLGDGESSMFSRMPTPPHATIDVSTLHRAQGPRSGMAAIVGQWPGEETEEEIEAALERLS